MPQIFEVVFVVITMITGFFLVFLFMFMLAMLLSPIEKNISEFVWKHTAEPPLPPAPATRGTFKDFSQKHQKR